VSALLSSIRDRPGWFFVACIIISAGVWRLPFIVEPNGNMAMIPSLGTWMSLGLIAGFLMPERPWRWAVAMAIANVIEGLVRAIVGATDLFGVVLIVTFVPLMAAPIALAAYAGRLLAGNRRPSADPVSARAARARAQEFLISTMLCAVVSLVIPYNWIAAALVAVTGVCAFVFAARRIVPPWGSGVLSASGAFAGFMIIVLIDMTIGWQPHNRLPFELWIVVLYTVPVGLLSAWLGHLLRRVRRSESDVA
jgi:hypothetical protein